MTLVEFLTQCSIAYIEPVFPGPKLALVISKKPDGIKFTVWKRGAFMFREDFATEEEAVAYMQNLMPND